MRLSITGRDRLLRNPSCYSPWWLELPFCNFALASVGWPMAVEAQRIYERRKRPRWVVHLALTLSCLAVASPMIFAVIKSTQDSAQVLRYPPDFTPGNSMLNNYSDALTKYNVARYIVNTSVVALAVTAGKTVLSLLAAMAFVYFRFPLKSVLFAFVLLTLLMPMDILIIGLFNLVTDTLGWNDNYLAL